MNARFPVSVLPAILIFVSAQNAEAQRSSKQLLDEGYKRYGIEFCTVTYELVGMLKGTETITFDRYGLREAKLTKTTMSAGTITVTTNTLTIMDGEFTYAIDLDKKTGTKTTNTMTSSLAQQYGEKNMEAIGDEMMKRMGGKKTGSETIAGKTCDRWDVAQLKSTSLVWKGIPLKTEVTLTGTKSGTTAVKVDDKTGVTDKMFQIPEGTKMQDKGALPDLMKSSKGKTK